MGGFFIQTDIYAKSVFDYHIAFPNHQDSLIQLSSIRLPHEHFYKIAYYRASQVSCVEWLCNIGAAKFDQRGFTSSCLISAITLLLSGDVI